jgi:predicted HAD superfamily Cof-like phosphohydrolase|tara:strand:- start:4057 stop:4377 length:321 start_codon:yes stop_codon:yes gene_type:complete
MESFVEVYAEYGAMGLVVLAFFYGYFKQSQRADEQAEALDALAVENKGQSQKINNLESILLKMLDRWNTSDSTRDRRHEDMVKEVNSLSDLMYEVKGSVSRINGKN